MWWTASGVGWGWFGKQMVWQYPEMKRFLAH
jgi:hypothetical protein